MRVFAGTAPPIYSYRKCGSCSLIGKPRCPYKDVMPNAYACESIEHKIGRRPNLYGPSLCLMNTCDCSKQQRERDIAWHEAVVKKPEYHSHTSTTVTWRIPQPSAAVIEK